VSNIFISHSSSDDALAEEIRAWLAEHGHESIFLDFHPDDGIPAGCDWERMLYRKLRASRAVVAVVTESFLASRWCFAEIALARMERKPVIPVLADPLDSGRPRLDLLSSTQNVDLRRGRDGASHLMARALAEAGIEPAPARRWRAMDPPYPGLEAFREEDAAVFFGRGSDASRALDMLRTARREGLLLVLGASGCGKSSFVRASVIPLLRRESRRWVVVGPLKPGVEPLQELASAIGNAFATPYEEVYAELIRTADLPGLLRRLSRKSGFAEATVVIIVDQLEESLQRSKNPEATDFLRLLRTVAVSENSPVVILATMRSDFLESLQQEPMLREATFDTLSLGPLSIDRIRETIEEPARLAQAEFEPGLVDQLLRDVATFDALPLLAFTLRTLWERARERSGELRIADYHELGGLQGAVAHVAESAAKASVLKHGEEMLRRLFLRFARVTEDGRLARQRCYWKQLPENAPEVLKPFVDSRLLVSGDDGTVSVCHEAVFRGWSRYADWLEEYRNELSLIEQLERQGEQWSQSSASIDYLWRGTRLAAATELMNALPGMLSDTATAFVRAGADLERKSTEHEQLVAAYNSVRLRALETYVQRYLRARREELVEEIAGQQSRSSFLVNSPCQVLKNELSVVDNELAGGGRWHPQEAVEVMNLGAASDYVVLYEFPCCGLRVLGDGGGSGTIDSRPGGIPQREGNSWSVGYGEPIQYRKDGCMEAP
jgi:hypothetical protein